NGSRPNELQRDHAPGDVDDRIHGADVVKVDLVRRRPVDASFGFREPREDPSRLVLDGVAEHAGLQDGDDVAERAMTMMSVVVDRDVHLRRPERALADLANEELPAGQRKLAQLGAKRVDRYTGVDQGGHDHVAGCAARTVEIDDAWHLRPVSGLRSERHEARGRSRPQRTRLYVRIGDDRERSDATLIG